MLEKSSHATHLILDAPNRKTCALAEVECAYCRVTVSGQVHVVRSQAIDLCRTPEVRIVARALVIITVARAIGTNTDTAVANRQRRKREIIRIAVIIPIGCGLESCIDVCQWVAEFDCIE